MATPSDSMRDLARRLLAASGSSSDAPSLDVVVVIEKLRASLTRFAGPEGFASLLRRALALASADVSALKCVRVGADGRMQGVDQLAAATGPGAVRVRDEAAVALATHLLGLLDSFVGEQLTLGLVRAAWPDLSLDGRTATGEGDQ